MALKYTGGDWIGRLPDRERQAIEARMSPRTVGKGQMIYAEGQMHEALWQVLSGTVRVTNQTADGKEVVFAIFAAGDCFGEITLLDGQPAANTATAMEQVELAELAKADFDELYRQFPAFAQQLLQMMTGRMRHMLNFYADVTLRPLEQRMANRILYLGGGPLLENNFSPLLFTQQDLASMVGATRQAVSKVLNQWREQGIVSLEYGKITVLLQARLEAVAEGPDTKF